QDYARSHLRGAISIPLNKSFSKWAGSLLTPDAPFALVMRDASPEATRKVARDLIMIGFDNLAGVVTAEESERLARESGGDEVMSRVDAAALDELVAAHEPQLLDVREPHEAALGIIPG